MKKYTNSSKNALKATISFAKSTGVNRKYVKSRFGEITGFLTTTIATSMIPAVVVLIIDMMGVSLNFCPHRTFTR